MNKFTNSKKGVARLFYIKLDKNLKAEHLKQIKDGFKIDRKLISVEEVSYVANSTKKEIVKL